MSIQSDKFRKTKLDQSPYLFHFIKGTEYEASATLKTILEEQKLRSKSSDYICFTASPITQVGSFFETKVNSTNQPMYQPYGIGFSRDLLIRNYGAKNVIYGDAEDKKTFVACGMGWRFLELDVDNYDFEWLREWRTPGKILDFSDFSPDHLIVIAPTHDKLMDYVVRDYCVESWDINDQTGEHFKDWVEFYDRRWKGTSLEYIRAENLINDYAVSGSTVSQKIGEDMCYEVSEWMSKRTNELNEMIARSLKESMGLE